MFNCIQSKHTIFFLLLYTFTIVPIKSMFPSSIFNYTIKAPEPIIIDNNQNTLLTKLYEECRNGHLHILNMMLNANHDEPNVRANIADMYQQFGFDKANAFIEMISSFASKTHHDSDKILDFINQDRKTYKDCNQTDAFFQSFKKAKKIYFFLANIEKKVLNNQALTSKESKYLLENIDLLDWKYSYKQPLVTRSFLSKFHQWNMQQTGSYLTTYWPSLIMFILAYIGKVSIGDSFSDNIGLCTGLTYGVVASIVGALGANFQVPQTEPLILPTNDVLSIEDM